jgi:hypothetical protein
MQKLFLILTTTLLFSCQNATKQQKTAITDTSLHKTPHQDTLPPTLALSEEEQEQRRTAFENKEKTYSIRQSLILNHALAYANGNKNQNSFQHEFTMTPGDSSHIVTTQMIFGHLFSPDKKHLLIRRLSTNQSICNIFLLEKENFKKVCEHEQFGLSHLEDSILDVNGDNYRDFLVLWYPYSNCCRRNVVRVYLYQPATGGFTRNYEFINPTFSSAEKIIRGVEYGHPGRIGLYKYQWNGLTVDTIEYIYPYANNHDKFIKTKTRIYKPTEDEGTVLNDLPKEYKRIEGIDWFLNY